MKYYWLKLKNDFFTQPKIKKLRKIAGGDTYTIIYLKMQLLSLKNDGRLIFEGIEEDFASEIALTIDEDPENVAITIQYLLAQGLMEQVPESEYIMTETQTLIGSESDSKERVRAYRERKKLREKIPLKLVRKLSNEQILLPDGSTKFIDNKRYGGNAEYVYELAGCKCEVCGETDTSKLLIHHNKGYSNDLEDLYLLCKKCHSNVEHGNIVLSGHRNDSVTCNADVTRCNTEIEIEKEIDIEIDKREEKKGRKKFAPPSVDDVRSYCQERKNGIDAQSFVDFYESKGWMVGKNKMKDWKAAVRTWERRRERTSVDIGREAAEPETFSDELRRMAEADNRPFEGW